MSKTEKVAFAADTNIEEALSIGPEVRAAFEKLGLKCVECVAAPVETLKHAALYHDKPLEEILRELNALGVRRAKPPQTPAG
jgi:hybrid cluster-associated redox disulfide protein